MVVAVPIKYRLAFPLPLGAPLFGFTLISLASGRLAAGGASCCGASRVACTSCEGLRVICCKGVMSTVDDENGEHLETRLADLKRKQKLKQRTRDETAE